MIPKLSNLDIPEIKAAAAEWAKASSQIEKITLHRFKPPKIQNPEGPFYAIIIWVSPEVDVTITPWEELVNAPDGKAPRAQVREQYKGQDGNIDTEKIEKHPLYDLWKLFDNLSDPIGRGYFDSFYRDGFERSDPRFDWIVLLLNIGAESLFEQGEEHDDLDSTEVGSAVLFSRKAEAPQENATTTQPPISVESRVPETIDLGLTKEKSKTWNELLKPGYYTGQYFVTQLGIKGFELFDLMKKGLQAYTSTGKKVVDSDPLPRGKRQSLDQVEANQRAKQNARVIGEPGSSSGSPCSEDDIKWSARRIYNNQSLEILNPPKNCVLMSFTLPINDERANEVISKVLWFQFRSVDVVKFANEYSKIHSFLPEETETEPTDPSAPSKSDKVNMAGEPQQMQGLPSGEALQLGQDFKEEACKINAEVFIHSLKVAYVNETTISITVPDKGVREFTCVDMGFKKSSVLWKPLIEILTNSDHKYHVGKYDIDKKPDKIKKYNALVKQLSNFSKKFVAFLNEKYSVSLPAKFNVFKNRKGLDPAGTYMAIFEIMDIDKGISKPVSKIVDKHDAILNNDIIHIPREETLRKIETLTMQIKREKDEDKQNTLLEENLRYVTHARKNRWINDEQLRNFITMPDASASPQDAMSDAEEYKEEYKEDISMDSDDSDNYLPSSKPLPF
jgi:hypothetical protein